MSGDLTFIERLHVTSFPAERMFFFFSSTIWQVKNICINFDYSSKLNFGKHTASPSDLLFRLAYLWVDTVILKIATLNVILSVILDFKEVKKPIDPKLALVKPQKNVSS